MARLILILTLILLIYDRWMDLKAYSTASTPVVTYENVNTDMFEKEFSRHPFVKLGNARLKSHLTQHNLELINERQTLSTEERGLFLLHELKTKNETYGMTISEFEYMVLMECSFLKINDCASLSRTEYRTLIKDWVQYQ